MGLFRIFRPITIDARQCSEAGTIATDLGFINVKRGDWIIRGEDNEGYILNDDFFQRTFAPVDDQQGSRESRGTPDRAQPVSANSSVCPSGGTVQLQVRGHRTRRLHAARRRNPRMN